MTTIFLYLNVVPVFVIFLRQIIRYFRSHSISHLPGPKKGSWLAGNLPDIIRPKEIGDTEFAWTEEYGSAICMKGTFGRDVLFLSDPKALQYILNTSGYNFPKTGVSRAVNLLLTGKGLTWAEGSQHARQRKIMNPAFSFSALRGFVPLFTHTARRTIVHLEKEVSQSGRKSAVINILPWLTRTTLDAIGAAGFNYEFGVIDQRGDNKLSRAYDNLFPDTFLERSDWKIAYDELTGTLPLWILIILQSLPSSKLKRLRSYMKTAREVAKEVVDRQTESYINGKEESKDIMSILVRANMAENPNAKLSEEEIISQLTTIFIAGHETSSNTITWALYELARHPEYQTRIRDEIKITRAQAAQRGDADLTIIDLDSMKCLLAVIKETLRFHPIVPVLSRQAKKDDVIPLAIPVKTKTGDTITSISVSPGQCVFMSFAAYNRLKPVWGENANQWRPERFLEDSGAARGTNLGVLANIITFSSGIRSCIGWRFAILEMQAIIVELLENFEFSPPPGNIEIMRAATGIMTPMVKGSTSRRTELPITITPI